MDIVIFNKHTQFKEYSYYTLKYVTESYEDDEINFRTFQVWNYTEDDETLENWDTYGEDKFICQYFKNNIELFQ